MALTPSEYTKLAIDWQWLIDLNTFKLIQVSPFGDLFMQDVSGALCLLDINIGQVMYAEVAGSNSSLLFPMAFDMVIATGYIEAGMMPVEGQCFGYKRQLVAGGSMELSNVYVAPMTEYISFMGDFHRQIQDIPDAGTVTIKVINKRVIQ